MNEPQKKRRVATAASAAGLLTAGVLSGAVLAGTMSANAATPTPSASSSSTTPAPGVPANFPAHGTAAHEDQEKAVTGAAATQAQAAAVKSLGGGTAGAVTTDFSGKGYEVTVTKADGTNTEVHLDSSLTVMKPGPHGPGDPGNAGRPDGAPQDPSTVAPSSSSSSSTQG